MKFKLQFAVKIEPISILASFTHWVLQFSIMITQSNAFHKLYSNKFHFFCTTSYGKSGPRIISMNITSLQSSRWQKEAKSRMFLYDSINLFLRFLYFRGNERKSNRGAGDIHFSCGTTGPRQTLPPNVVTYIRVWSDGSNTTR